MVVQRGEVWWAELDEPIGSAPAYRRPVLIIQSDAFNRSRIGTVIAVVLTSNVRLVEAPGNVLLSKRASGLPKESVVNVSQIVTLDRSTIAARVARLDDRTMREIDRGIRLVLGL